MIDDSTPSVEYLLLFSNEGSIEVSVKFVGSQAKVANRRMDVRELQKLIDPATGAFLKTMRFDDWPATIKKIEIQPEKSKMIIHAAL